MAQVLVDGSIFLHIPKTGGSWVTAALKDQNLIRRKVEGKHACMDRVLYERTRFAPWRREFFTFCFVRNPLSWYESWFKFMSDPKQNWRDWGSTISGRKGWHPNAILNGCGAEDFNTFVANVVRKRPGYVTELFGWYTKPPISFIGRQENLAEDLIRVLSMRGIAFDEQRIRSSIRENVSGDHHLEWDPDLRRDVVQLEYAAFRRFGYEPE
ncbi:MAG: hypothetical protein GC190_03285 [Alphaproteobacteria bacterium]|nr:hypothetical protein [Alphaproteobacteria bacterium]